MPAHVCAGRPERYRSLFDAAARPAVNVLDACRELGSAQADERARVASRARVLELDVGCWIPDGTAREATTGMGLLIIAGLLLHETTVNGRCAAELLADGDLINPACETDGFPVSAGSSRWRVLVPCRLAILDARWVARMAGFPDTLTAVSTCHLRRARLLAVAMAITAQPRLDQRLLMLFWHLADRFGTVHRDGVHLCLPLTHETLGHLALARRPSVSSALSRLEAGGALARLPDGWLLPHEDMPLTGSDESHVTHGVQAVGAPTRRYSVR